MKYCIIKLPESLKTNLKIEFNSFKKKVFEYHRSKMLIDEKMFLNISITALLDQKLILQKFITSNLKFEVSQST